MYVLPAATSTPHTGALQRDGGRRTLSIRFVVPTNIAKASLAHTKAVQAELAVSVLDLVWLQNILLA